MDRSKAIKLISKTYTEDTIGQLIPTETEKTVYCNLKSTSRQEWKAAGEMGLNPKYVITMFSPDYNGEQIAKIDNVKYAIYRTYQTTNDLIELYCEEKAGV